MSEITNPLPVEIVPTPSTPKINFQLILIIILSLALFSLGLVYAYNLGKKTLNVAVDNSPTPTKSEYPTPTTTYLSPTNTPTSVTVSIDPGKITWLEFPQSIKINIYKSPDSSGYIDNIPFKDISYHHVANFVDGSKLINVIVPFESMGTWYEIQRFIQIPTGKIYYLSNIDNFAQARSYLLPNIEQTDYQITDLESPSTLNLPKIKLNKNKYTQILSFTELKSPQLFAETQYGRIYVTYSIQEYYPPLHSRNFYPRLKDDTLVGYEIVYDFLTDDRVPKITFLDGSTNSVNYETGIRGGKCGGLIDSIIPSNKISLESLVRVGTVNTNYSSKDIYRISDINNSIIKYIFQEYQVGRDIGSSTVIVDIKQFIDLPTHFLWRDNIGDWSLFSSGNYSPMAECGKPVIYLYPTKDTQVSVNVGANITKSEPTYPDNGWTVLAHPNGQLDYQDKTYPNLFWEGTGYGAYNQHLGEGFVVPQSKLISTLYSQLKEQGLNVQESADFMEFWQSKLPTSPYVRLTWLNTQDMNELAPLRVSPSPKTAIRVFLEFDGLEKPISLKPQTLSAPPRQGFTLIEWGGLLVK